MLSVRRNIHSVEPCFCCRHCVIKEQQVSGNGSIGTEHRAGQSDNGVQIKLADELFLDVYLRIVQTEQETIRYNDGCSAVLFQTVQDHRHEQIGSFRACQIVGEEALNGLVLMSAIRRVHQNHIELIIIRIVQKIMLQRVHMIDVGNFNIVQQHIGHTEQIRERLFLDSVNTIVKLLLSRSIGYLFG